MRSTIRRILSFFIIPACFFVLSCASVNNKTGSLSSVYVTNTKKIELLSPDNVEKNIDSLQLLNASFGKQTFSLLAFIEVDNNGIFISLMNDLGTDMGNLSYNGESVFFDSSLFPKALKAEYIVADPLYRPICNPASRFYSLPHLAFSGRCFIKKMVNLLEDDYCEWLKS